MNIEEVLQLSAKNIMRRLGNPESPYLKEKFAFKKILSEKLEEYFDLFRKRNFDSTGEKHLFFTNTISMFIFLILIKYLHYKYANSMIKNAKLKKLIMIHLFSMLQLT